ncbi:acetylglutamate kinase [Weissella confusa]|uniref:acetylglutamate kinase n=1 Tax=Weissella confusa TaxID=1583 RepID=UPI001091FB0E|nr:acetylglutamate kinase [Weissella confusa]MBJ7693613.1 acetylglutamate kinase [Weissella confusa]QBZ03714.1 acetylglutamate kinase [Weissella confusa]
MKVIKIGGNALKNLNIQILNQMQAWLAIGEPVILVHGAGPMVNEALTRAKLPVKKIDGLRYTDQRTLAIMQDVVQAQVWPMLQHVLGQAHMAANLLTEGVQATLKAEGEYGRVGEIKNVAMEMVTGQLYVIGPLVPDERGELLNVNADEIALAIARHFMADSLYFLTDVDGVLNKQQEVVSNLTPIDASNLVQQQIVTDGMFVKIQAAFAAIRAGVTDIRLGKDFETGTKLILGE